MGCKPRGGFQRKGGNIYTINKKVWADAKRSLNTEARDKIAFAHFSHLDQILFLDKFFNLVQKISASGNIPFDFVVEFSVLDAIMVIEKSVQIEPPNGDIFRSGTTIRSADGMSVWRLKPANADVILDNGNEKIEGLEKLKFLATACSELGIAEISLNPQLKYGDYIKLGYSPRFGIWGVTPQNMTKWLYRKPNPKKTVRNKSVHPQVRINLAYWKYLVEPYC